MQHYMPQQHGAGATKRTADGKHIQWRCLRHKLETHVDNETLPEVATARVFL